MVPPTHACSKPAFDDIFMYNIVQTMYLTGHFLLLQITLPLRYCLVKSDRSEVIKYMRLKGSLE